MKSRIFTQILLLVSVFAVLTTSAQAQIPREHTRILALGDSITEGIGNATSYRFDLRNELNNTACSFEMVGRLNTNRDGTFVSPHEGYSGHGVEFFLNSQGINPGIEAIIGDADPDVVLIHLGSNDANRSQTAPNTISELGQLVNRIWNVKPEVSIYVANVIPWFGASNNPNIAAAIQALGPAIRNWINGVNSNQLHFVQVKIGYQQSFMQPDGIHPNAAGDSFIADAFLSAITANNDCPTPPVTFISSPLNEGETLPASHTYTGSAIDTDGDGIQRVRVAIRDNSLDQWWNFAAGTFGAFSEDIATLFNATPTTVEWRKTVTLPSSGNYTFFALAVDNLGNQDYFNTGFWPTNTDFFTSSDNSAPSIASISTPATQDALLSPGTTLSGTASDTGGSGFGEVRISIRNRDLNRWYIFGNGTASKAATLANTSNISTDWLLPNTLPVGNYTVFAKAFDAAGNSSASFQRRFSVQAPDTQAPTAAISSPAIQDDVLSRGTAFTGTASDTGGSGFDEIRISVRNRDTNRWFIFGNGTATKVATLTNTTATNTDWTLPQLIQAGNYTLFVTVLDRAGNSTANIRRRFSIQ